MNTGHALHRTSKHTADVWRYIIQMFGKATKPTHQLSPTVKVPCAPAQNATLQSIIKMRHSADIVKLQAHATMLYVW